MIFFSALLVARELVEEVLLRELLPPVLLASEALGDGEYWHQRVAVDAVGLDFRRHLHRVLQRLRQVGEHLGHLLRALQPLLLGVVQAVGVVIVLLRGQTDEVVVGVAVLLGHEMGVVGGHQLDVVLPGQSYQLRLHLHLPLVSVVVGVGLVGLVAHQLDVVVVAEALLEPQHLLLGLLQLAGHDELRNLATQARRADDEALLVLLQHIVVDARTVVETVGVGYRCQLAERMVPFEVLGQQDEVVAAAVHHAFFPVFGIDILEVLVLVIERATGAVGLGAHDGLKLRLPFGTVLVLLRHSVEQVLDADFLAFLIKSGIFDIPSSIE